VGGQYFGRRQTLDWPLTVGIIPLRQICCCLYRELNIFFSKEKSADTHLCFLFCLLTEEDKVRWGHDRERGGDENSDREKCGKRERARDTCLGSAGTHTVHSKHKVAPSIRIHAGPECVPGEKQKKLINKG
jgi:hypothetical protein